MCDAPAKIAATNVKTLRPGSAPPTRPTSRTVWLISTSSPRRTISVAGTINPASATNVSSSNVTSMRSIARDTRLTGSASRVGDNGDFEHRHRPSPGRLFRGYATPQTPTSSADRGLDDPRADDARGPVGVVGGQSRRRGGAAEGPVDGGGDPAA